MEQVNCSLEAVSSTPQSGSRQILLHSNMLHVCVSVQKFFNPRVQRDGSLQGINHNRFMVTDRDIYLGELTDALGLSSPHLKLVSSLLTLKQKSEFKRVMIHSLLYDTLYIKL